MKRMLKGFLVFTIITSLSISLVGQDRTGWKDDLHILTDLIEKNHPVPWMKVSREDFLQKAKSIEAGLGEMDRETFNLELMKLTALIGDGHTRVLLDNQENFDLWFPVRIEKFSDGLFITGTETGLENLIGARVIRIGDWDADTACEKISSIIATDSDHGIPRRLTNFLSNAIVLNRLGVISSESTMQLEVIDKTGIKSKTELLSSSWRLSFEWSYDKKIVPACTSPGYFFGSNDSLPLYLSNYFESPNKRFWFTYIESDRIIYYQINQIFDDSDISLSDYTEKFLEYYDNNENKIDKLIIDLRFNEGGDFGLIPAIVERFRRRNDQIKQGDLYIITGANTFSAATNFIGQMKKETNAITVGDIASGPLNQSGDPIMYLLPNSNTLLNISRLYQQYGHPTDKRGYYPPDYYIPNSARDYFAFRDPVIDSILNGNIRSLEEILFSEGFSAFEKELKLREDSFGDRRFWFPYTSYGMALFVFEDLISSGKFEEAVAFSKLNSEIYPESIWGWFISGMINENIGDNEAAYKCFEKLLQLEPYHREALWEIEKIGAILKPYKPEEAWLRKLTGEYGSRKISFEEGSLNYQVGNGSKRKLIPVSDTKYLIENSNYRLVFDLTVPEERKIKITEWDGKTSIYHQTGK